MTVIGVAPLGDGGVDIQVVALLEHAGVDGVVGKVGRRIRRVTVTVAVGLGPRGGVAAGGTYSETAIAGTSKKAASTAALTVPDRPRTYAPMFAPRLQPATTRSMSGRALLARHDAV